MFANRIGYSDINPYEIIGKFGKIGFIIREMECVLNFKPEFITGGFSAHCTNNSEQKWIIKPNENNPSIKVRLHKDGYLHDRNGGKYAMDDIPLKVYDFNF